MKSLKISSYNNFTYLRNILEKYHNSKTRKGAFTSWLLVWYFGFSILLLLSMHSYYMGIVK